MALWESSEAKRRFEALIDKALKEGPQTIVRDGQEIAVVLAADDLRKLISSSDAFKDLLRTIPEE